MDVGSGSWQFSGMCSHKVEQEQSLIFHYIHIEKCLNKAALWATCYVVYLIQIVSGMQPKVMGVQIQPEVNLNLNIYI